MFRDRGGMAPPAVKPSLNESLSFPSARQMRPLATLAIMQIGPDVNFEDELISALVSCGREAHRVAQAHHNDPGSNGFTFGTDRYQRATQLAVEVLSDDGFKVARRGAGLVARRGDLELQFAVARGIDLTDPASFDADSSPARRKAGASNANQLTFDGMPESEAALIVHVVWSGTPEAGQTAVHAGRLVLGASDRLDWAVLVRLDDPVDQRREGVSPAPRVPTYVDQPEPALRLSPKPSAARSNEG